MTIGGRQKPPCVVVVDDHKDSCRALVRLLAHAGYRVVSAHSVREAREAIERHGCDLLIADIGLPDGSGLDLLADVRVRHGVKKAIALTGLTDKDDVKACLAAGFNAYMSKPVQFEELETLIAGVLNDPDGQETLGVAVEG